MAEGSTVNLDGTAMDADLEDTLTYSWSHNSTLAITLTDGGALIPSFTAPNVPEDTAVEFTLSVSDGTASVSDTVDVTITDSANSPPAVNAGDDQTVAEGSTVNLDGTAMDTDLEDTLTYSWSHNSTLAITLTDGGAILDPSFTAPNVPEDTTVEFTLSVSDGTASVSDTVDVTITDSANSPPAVNAGDDQTVAEGSTVNLDGTAMDTDLEDTLTYSWSHNSTLAITLTDGGAILDPSFTAPNVPEDTTVEFTLSVSDGTASVSDTVDVTITDSANSSLAVDAGQPQMADEGNTVTLSGTATDPDESDILTHTWTQVSPPSPAIVFANSSALSTTFTAPQVDTDTVFTLRLRVSDGSDTAADTIQVTVRNRPVQTGSASGTWTVDDVVRILDSKGDHSLMAIATCDEGTRVTGATAGTYLEGMWSAFGGGVYPSASMAYGASDFRGWAPGEWLFFTVRHNTSLDRINDDEEGRIGKIGPTLNEYIDAAPGDVFEYPHGRLVGNHTKSQIGDWAAYGLSITWEGHGSCRTSLDHWRLPV